PAMPSAMTSSASPYISAVSIWVMPRSRQRRKAAIAAARLPPSRYQVPCPITETGRCVDPKARRSILSAQVSRVLRRNLQVFLIDETPDPALPGLQGRHEGMLRSMEVRSRVLAWRAVATAHMSALQAHA